MRGVVYRAYRKKSPVLAWILSALLFGLLHMNLNQMPYAFFLGIIMVVMMEASDSLITSMCIHFFVNGISTITGYFSQLEVQSPAAEVLLQEKEMFLSMGLLAVCMIPLILLLIVATLRVNKRKFCMITEKETSEMEYAEQKILDPWLLLTLIVMVVLIAMDTFR